MHQMPTAECSSASANECALNVLVCDDEAGFLVRMRTALLALSQANHLNLKLCCIQDPAKLEELDLSQIDIAFLDIDMGTVNGIDLARYIRKTQNETVLIFVTNYVEYSLDGYEVQAFRYLLKSELKEKLPGYFEQAVKACSKNRVLVRFSYQRNEMDLVPSHILFIETCQRHLLLHLIDEPRETLSANGSISEVAAQLEPFGFLQIHQSYLVNMTFIHKMQSTGVWLKNGAQLPISSRSYRDLKQQYLTWKGTKRWNS